MHVAAHLSVHNGFNGVPIGNCVVNNCVAKIISWEPRVLRALSRQTGRQQRCFLTVVFGMTTLVVIALC